MAWRHTTIVLALAAAGCRDVISFRGPDEGSAGAVVTLAGEDGGTDDDADTEVEPDDVSDTDTDPGADTGADTAPDPGPDPECPTLVPADTALVGGIWYRSIQSAIDAAGEGDVVFVYPGTHHVNLVVTKTVEIVGCDEPALTVLDGNQEGPVISLRGADLTLRRLTIHRGRGGFKEGGGIDAHRYEGGDVRLVRTDLSENVSGPSPGFPESYEYVPTCGGGVRMGTGNLTAWSTTFSANVSGPEGSAGIAGGQAGDGGAVFVPEGASATFVDCTFTGNAALRGGAVSTRGPVVFLGETLIADNTASLGGGVYAVDADVEARGVVIENNRVAPWKDIPGRGGGAHLGGEVAWTGGVFRNNRARGNGGGLYADGEDVVVTGVTLASNRASSKQRHREGRGGGLGVDGSASIVECSIAANEAEKGGGGAWIEQGRLDSTGSEWGSRLPPNAPDDVAIQAGESYRVSPPWRSFSCSTESGTCQ